MENKNLLRIEKIIIIFFVLVLVIAIIAIYAYLDTFAHGNFWNFGDQNAFGAFGDYIGGVLNPLFSFFTIVLLVWSLQMQRNELALNRKELEKSSKALDAAQRAHHENIKLQEKENLRRQIHDDFEHHYKQYKSLCNKKIAFGKEMNYRNPINLLSDISFSLYEMLNANDNDIATDFISSISERMNGKSKHDIGTLTLLEIASELDYITMSVNALFKLLDTYIVAFSINDRVHTLLTECYDLKIINDDAFNVFIKRITPPDRLTADLDAQMPI